MKNTLPKDATKIEPREWDTLSYAAPLVWVESLIAQLDEATPAAVTMIRTDNGPDPDGHLIECFWHGTGKKGRTVARQVFWAMVGTSGRYLVRAPQGLFETVPESE